MSPLDLVAYAIMALVALQAVHRVFTSPGAVWLLHAAVLVIALYAILANLLFFHSASTLVLPASAAGVLVLWLVSRSADRWQREHRQD